MSLKVVEMNIDHMNFLLQCLSDFDDFWNEKILKDEFSNNNSKYFVVTDGMQVLGFAGVWFNIDEAHVMNIAVKKEFRRKHLGSKLLDFLINVAKENGKICITLEVNESNKPAIGLYQKAGFNIVGRRKKYYENRFDAIIMTKSLKN